MMCGAARVARFFLCSVVHFMGLLVSCMDRSWWDRWSLSFWVDPATKTLSTSGNQVLYSPNRLSLILFTIPPKWFGGGPPNPRSFRPKPSLGLGEARGFLDAFCKFHDGYVVHVKLSTLKIGWRAGSSKKKPWKISLLRQLQEWCTSMSTPYTAAAIFLRGLWGIIFTGEYTAHHPL